jgi:hypothetical protein
MVTPETGVITFIGTSGKVYALSFYSSDVVGAYVTFATSGLAGTGSQTFWNTPEPVTIMDISVITGQTVSTIGRVQVNDVDVGTPFAWANVVNTLANRNFAHASINGKQKFTILQA